LAIVKIEQGKLYKQELEFTNEKVNLLEGRIVLKDSIITFLKENSVLMDKKIYSFLFSTRLMAFLFMLY
jgi:hypothetical protein